LARRFAFIRAYGHAIDGRALRSSPMMPIGSRRQLNELPDDLAAKITIHYYTDARDALLKALAI